MRASDSSDTPVCIQELLASLHEWMSPAQRVRLTLKALDDQKLCIDIDGERRPSAITVWANGACDVDWLEMPTKQAAFKTLYFSSNRHALSALIYEVQFALERA
jgi:hypothetical protein